ncbi:hypothetical protein BAUCODRAFT_80670 [Baudoinia panamericana UAMH 10762]|uniref:HypA-like protein n=1 Tax=Baudoinia panamericana (strain UAMH 10762) TaxID=717646 RepID=M2M3L9_BAUPA|nr:uncharacterized protein BAUCODRAFT_80670 [Baudoinia panamericana UAMH 10762]EMC91151.1 hypothetical protein BAUCODRAFT_80670 [Baudoinia panamericana UAMH 10762]
MATGSTIRLTRGEWPVYYRPGIIEESAQKASGLLQTNHDNYHIFFNPEGFHNHIAHHLLTIYALRAGAGDIQKAYEVNKGYQREQGPSDHDVVSEMRDPATFSSYLGRQEHYANFLQFFRSEIDSNGWQNVVNKYIFARTDRADDLLCRAFAGFLHPLIHLGFGIEFKQPAVIAEALAQAAVHGPYMSKFLLPAEAAAQKHTDKPSRNIVELLDEIHADEGLLAAPKWSDGNKLRDGIIGRGADQMINYASQFHVEPDELERKTAEMTNAAVYYTAGSQRPDKKIMYDFYYMHCVNCSVFFSAFLQQPWLGTGNKIRLLEWKVRNDLAMYASRKSPEIRLDEIRKNKPNKPSGWDGVEDRAATFEDDGHTSKLIRALAHGAQICKPYEDSSEFRVKSSDWLPIAHTVLDSVEAGEPHWVRSAGFDEAWEKIPARAQL